MHDFPTLPEQLTSGWLTDTLAASGALKPGAVVDGFDTAIIGDGIGLLGMVVRVTLHCSPAGSGPASVVIKFAHPDAANRAIANNTRMYEREVTFFTRIARSIDVPMPACHFAAVDIATGENIVVLEDLRAYRPADQVAGVGPEEATLVLDAVTPMLAAFWGRTDQPMLDDAMRIDSNYIDAFLPSIMGTWERCVELFGDCIAPDVLAELPRYVASMRELHLLMGRRTQTLVHGDLRLDNVMLGTEAQQHPVVLIDWQAVMVSNPMHDLGYLLSQSLSIDTRRRHEDELVTHFHDRLHHLGISDLTMEECWAGYDAAVLFLFSYPLIIGGAFDPANERGRKLAEELLRRSSQTVSDRNLLALLP